MHFLVAGAGVLGRELIHVLLGKEHEVTALALDEREFTGLSHPRLHCRTGDVTRPETLCGIAEGVQVVISCIGITRISGHLTHMDVDYKGNLNLLREAERASVEKFAIVSPEGVEEGRGAAPLLEARDHFERELRQSTVGWIIVHSGGFFCDLAEMAKMAKKSPLFVIGDGHARFTPIAVSDLALIVADEVEALDNEMFHVGGPETLTWNEISRLCFSHWNLKPRIYHVPVALCRWMLAIIKPFSPKYYAMGRLLVFMYTNDLPTPERGCIRLSDYLKENLA